MEAFAFYLFKSSIWLTGFTLVYLMFLRDERFFLLKRIYLISGILISFVFPLITVHYKVELSPPAVITNGITTAVQRTGPSESIDYRYILLMLYLSGALFFAFRLIWQARSLYKTINKANINDLDNAKLVRTSEISSSFSFFKYVFINPSVGETEEKEIMNHELVHVHQKHWFDLFMVELLCMFQWVNPFAWIYSRIIRLNHEYLADEAALQRTTNPAIYKAALLNQLFSSPVISLSNSFGYSLNKKRFDMMKKIITSPYRKMKVLFVLPVFAIVLYAFATPEYSYTNADKNSVNIDRITSIQKNEVKGTVVQQDGNTLHGAAIIIIGTTAGTTSDDKGSFSLKDVPPDGELVISYVGFKSKVMRPVFGSDMTIKMIRDTLNLEKRSKMPSPPPPPPPPPPPAGSADSKSTETPTLPASPMGLNIKGDGPPPLYIVDGVIIDDFDKNKIDHETIESIIVLKEKSAIDKYGDKGKNGVIIITSKKVSLSNKDEEKHNAEVSESKSTKEQTFIVVEELPEFPGGGNEAMWKWIGQNIKYPVEAAKGGITGKVYVDFLVSSTGEVKDVSVKKSVHKLLDAEAIRVISSMPGWKPGSQSGKPVDVQMTVPIEFKLH